MTEWKTYEEPPPPVQGDIYKPIEHVGAVIVVKVNELRDGIVTENSPNGGPGIFVDLVDLGNEQTYRDVLWMGGAMVDGLKRYVGGIAVVEITSRKSKSGRPYPVPVGVNDATVAQAKKFVEKHDPFAPAISTPDDDELPPF